MRESLTKLDSCAQLYVQTEEHHAFSSHLLMCDTIRLLPQQLWRPHQWPRQCVDTKAWQWRTEQSLRPL